LVESSKAVTSVWSEEPFRLHLLRNATGWAAVSVERSCR
jgi:hypothetical protein